MHTWRRVVAGRVLDAHAGRQPRAEIDVLPLEGQVALVERRQARKLPRGHSAVPSPTASQLYYDLPELCTSYARELLSAKTHHPC